MKVLLINTPTKNMVSRDMAGGLGFDGGPAVILPPLDFAYMAATLLKNNFEVKIIDSDFENLLKYDVLSIAGDYNPDFIIATVSLPSIYNDCAFIKLLNKKLESKIFVKTGINYKPILKEIIDKSTAELCIYGECDLNIHKILTGEDKNGTAYYSENDFIVENNTLIENLDLLPLPARNLLKNDIYYYGLLGEKTTVIQTSRGCPYQCYFYCPYPLVQGRKWRPRSPENVIVEIKDIVNTYGIKRILFRDATFTLDKNRIHSICDKIIENKFDIEWWCETRVDCLDYELMKKMKDAGCKGMNIGVETGDDEVMETQAKIGLSIEKLKVLRAKALELGLKLHFLLILGLPKETKHSIYKTYSMITELKPESLGICLITPYPGTPLYDMAVKENWIEVSNWEKYGGHFPVAHTDKLKRKDLIFGLKMINKNISLKNPKGFFESLKKKYYEYRFKRWAGVL